MKIVITGGAGFLGLHLARYLVKKKNSVILFDIHSIEKKEYPKGCSFIQGDVRDKQALVKVLRNIDVVIHTAAALPLWKEKDILAINVQGAKNVFDACVINKVKRVIHISSTAVYGVPKKHPINEDDPLVGVGPYGISKIQAEKICSKYREKGLIITVIRPKTFVGTERLGVFEILFDWIKDGKKIPVLGHGYNRYQLLDVDDLVDAVYRFILLKDKRKANDTFNIGAKDFRTVREDLQKVFDFAGSGSKIFETNAWLIKSALWFFEKIHLSPLYQWVYDTADKDSYVSIQKIVKILHWEPQYSNSQALIKSYAWYQKHYKEIKSRPAGITHTVGWKQGILGFFKRFF